MQDGFLTVSVIDNTTNAPIKDATVNIYSIPQTSGESPTPVLQNLKTNESGQVTNLSLPAPDIAYSEQPSDVQPYSDYLVEVIADGYETVLINGTQVFPTVEARQPVPLTPRTRCRSFYSRQNEIVFDIGAHTLFGNYPPKIPEASLKHHYHLQLDSSYLIILLYRNS